MCLHTGHTEYVHDNSISLKKDERTDDPRLLQQAVEHIYNHQRDGDLLIDAPTSKSWEDLEKIVADRDAWKRIVQTIKDSKTPTRKQKRGLKPQ